MTVTPVQNQYSTTTSGTTTYTINTIGGGGGSSGSILTNTGWSIAPPSTIISSTVLSIKPSDNGDAIIETHSGKINLDAFYKEVCDRVCIIIEDKKLHEKSPTLQDAYEKYLQAKKEYPVTISSELREAYNEYKVLAELTKENIK